MSSGRDPAQRSAWSGYEQQRLAALNGLVGHVTAEVRQTLRQDGELLQELRATILGERLGGSLLDAVGPVLDVLSGLGRRPRDLRAPHPC